MNKFVKVSLITAGVLMAAGIVFCFISAVIGDSSMMHLVKNGEYPDELHMVGDTLENITDRIAGISWHHNLGTNPTHLTVNGKRVKDKVWKEQIPVDNIKDLNLELGAGEFYIREKDVADGMVDIVVEGVGGCNYQVKDKTLHIEGFTGIKTLGIGINTYKNSIVLAFPAGSSFREADIEAGAGTMEIASLQADEISVMIGAGEIVMNQTSTKELSAEIGAGRLEAGAMDAREVSIQVGMGECIYEGTITDELNAECDMGNIELSLNGKESDYNYEVECSAGNIDINGTYISAFGAERSIQNGASRTFKLECNMGNITVLFKE